MSKSLSLATLTTFALVGLMVSPQAAPSRALEAISKAPLTVLTYGLNNLDAALSDAFTGPNAAPYSKSVSPIDGSVAGLTTVLYDEEHGTITLNLVRIDKIPDDVTPAEACDQALAALRTFAGLTETGEMWDGMDASGLAYYFLLRGSPAEGATLAEIDKVFRLRYSASSSQQQFTCSAGLYDAEVQMKVY